MYKNKICKICGKEYTPLSGFSKFCHGCYKRVRYLQEKRYRNKRYYSNIRENILERDKYKCVKCGSTKNLCIHHLDESGIKGKQVKYKPNNNPNNLITLCKVCHNKEHIFILKTGNMPKYFKPKSSYNYLDNGQMSFI